jgi:hypothetical protein
LRSSSFSSRGFAAVLATAVASSVLAFAIFVIVGLVWPTGNRGWKMDDLPATIAIVAIWAPAIALIPAGVFGLLVERPKARTMIKRRAGGFASHMVLSVAAAALFWLLFRIGVHYAYPTNPLIDIPSLALFCLIGLCSGISWWFLVVAPGRRA